MMQLSECLSWLYVYKSSSNMGHVGSKVGHKVKLKENLVNTVEDATFASEVWNFVRMGHIGSDIRSLGQIEGKSC